VSSGSLTLDRLLGTGGWPRGRIVELFGATCAGKTTLVLETIAQAQHASGTAALIDADHATSPEAAERLGVDPELLVIHRSNILEDVFEQIEQFIQRGVDVIALDSIAALVREADAKRMRSREPEVKDEEHQRYIEHALKRLLGHLYSSQSVLLITNQLREKLGVMYGDPTTTPWETLPLKDFASVRAEVKRCIPIKEGGRTLGYEERVRITKNRFAAPLVEAEFEMYFATGINREGELITLGLDAEVLTKSGDSIRFGEVVLGRSRRDAVRSLQNDVLLAARVRELVVASFGPSAATAAWAPITVEAPTVTE